MANMRLAMGARNALADSLASLIDAGDGPGTITFYTGPQPANVNTAVDGQLLLGVLTCSYPVADRAIAGVLAFNAIAEDSAAAASGKAAWARIADSNGNAVIDCDVTGPQGGGTIEINSTDIVEGGPIRMRGFTITFPAG